MAENNGNKNVTASDLLSRLAKSKSSQEPSSQRPSFADYVNKAPEKEDFVMIEEEATAKEEYSENTEEQINFYEPADEYVEEGEPEIEEQYYEEEAPEYVAGDEIYPEAPEAEEYYADEYAEYAQYADTDAPAEYAEFDPNAVETYDASAYDEEYVDGAEYEDYGDILPEDDFFDNDPIEEEEYFEEPVYEAEEEYDEERDFENLVAEVNAQTGSSDDLDETDIGLMVALGMEDELAKSMGRDVAAQITDDYVEDQEEWVDRTNRYGAGEYADPSENGEIAREYKKRNRIAFWSMLAAFAFAVVLLVFENLPVVGFQPSGALDPKYYPVVYLMFDLQFVMFSAACAIRAIGRGFKNLFKGHATPEAIPALMTVTAIIVTIVTAYSAVPGVEPKVFNFPTALCLFFAAVGEYLTVRREIFSFNIVSSNRPKYVMRRLSIRDSVLENEAVSDFDSPVADEGDVIKIQKTDFVDGYFWRTSQKSTRGNGYSGLAIVISFVLAIIAAVYAGIFAKIANPVGVGFAVLSAAMPASMVIVSAYPFYRANRQAYESDSTIVGDASVDEYSGIGVISFDDVNVFPSSTVKVRNVRLFNNCRIDKVLYYAASVFTATGGPLSDVFEVATMETGHSENVEILETGSGYIEANVNGKNVMFGSAMALSRLGIIIPEEVMAEDGQLPIDCTVMYMIYQRKLVSKMIVNYIIDPDFEYILKQLTGSGMCVCVKTFDPNIDEEMIFRQIKSGKYSLRVIKYKNTEEITKYSKRAEGGIVSRNSTKSLLHTVASCDKIIGAKKTGSVIGIISAILSAVIMCVVIAAGAFGSMHSVYIALCQLFWLIPAIITTKLIVR